MKQFNVVLLYTCLFLISFTLQAQNKNDTTAKAKQEEQIRKYWFVMLMKGSNRTQDSSTAVKIQKEHLANINHLYNEGNIKVAGPCGDN